MRSGSLVKVKALKLLVVGILVASVFTIDTTLVYAAKLTPTEQQELRDKSKRALEEREKVIQAPDVHLQEKKTTETLKELPVEDKMVQIDRIILIGDSASRFGWAQKLLDQYGGQKIGSQGINLILKEVTDGFISRGYITTRVQIGEQDLTTGTLEITVVPGRVGKVRFAEEGQKGSWWTAFPTKSGRILNLRDLEQGLEQMKRVPSQDVEMDLAPGEKPGETDVVIKLQKKKAWRVTLSSDDSGSKSTGRYQGTISGSLDNPLQHNDLFSYSFTTDLDKHGELRGSRNHSYHYSMPLGYWTFSFGSYPSSYHQTVEGKYSNFKMSGESQNYNVKAQWVVFRDQDRKITLDASINRKFSKSFLEELELEAQRKNHTYIDFGASLRKNFSTGLADIRIGGKRGLRWLGAFGDLGLPDEPTFEYVIGTLDINLVQQFKFKNIPMKYSMDFRGQATESKLYGSEWFSIGNRYSVRGFDGEYTLSAENGFYVRNELGIPINQIASELYFGLDYGQVTGSNAKYLIGNKLAGGAIGLRGGNKGFFYDVFAGIPVYKPSRFESPNVVYGFQLGYQY